MIINLREKLDHNLNINVCITAFYTYALHSRVDFKTFCKYYI